MVAPVGSPDGSWGGMTSRSSEYDSPPRDVQAVRVLLVCHRWNRERSESGLVRAVEAELGAQRHAIEDGWPSHAALDAFDCVIVFVRFRELAARPALDWGNFDGRRIMLEHDAYMNYVDVAISHHRGRWPEEFHRHRFDSTLR